MNCNKRQDELDCVGGICFPGVLSLRLWNVGHKPTKKQDLSSTYSKLLWCRHLTWIFITLCGTKVQSHCFVLRPHYTLFNFHCLPLPALSCPPVPPPSVSLYHSCFDEGSHFTVPEWWQMTTEDMQRGNSDREGTWQMIHSGWFNLCFFSKQVFNLRNACREKLQM